MNHALQIKQRALLLVATASVLIAVSTQMRADTGSCGGALTTLPFTDVPASNGFFCQIAAAYFSGLTNGTSATTYSPSTDVTREQMAAFVSRTLDQSLRRGSRRAALGQWWTLTDPGALRPTSFPPGANLHRIVCDGQDLWVSDENSVVHRVRTNDGKLLGTWTGATGARGLIVAAGRIFVVGNLGSATPGKIYVINPEAAPGPVTIFENDIGAGSYDITFDGANLWTANLSGSISRVNVGTGIDSTFTTGFVNPVNILWDGANLWVNDGQLKRVDPLNGIVLETIALSGTSNLVFDGANLWLSSSSNHTVSVVRAVGGLRGTVLQTLTGNGLNNPYGMAFDGERVLVCNLSDGNSVSLFKAADFTPLGNVSTGTNSEPRFACSDGVNFWIIRYFTHDIVRF